MVTDFNLLTQGSGHCEPILGLQVQSIAYGTFRLDYVQKNVRVSTFSIHHPNIPFSIFFQKQLH
jgi:hypothetical protein